MPQSLSKTPFRSRIFLLSPANTSAIRAQLLLSRDSNFELAQRFRREGAPLGEVFSFISSLYFRGKIAYVNKFSNPPIGLPPQLIMTTSSGLLPTDTVVTIDDLKGMSRVPIDNSGNVLAKYTQTLSFDDPLAELRSGTTTFYQVDGTKSITSLSDTASTLAGTYVYDAFGNLSSSTGFLTNPFRYTGREFDAETGLYYYRTRYYDSGIGRFASEDSIRFKGGINFYPYVRNRPVTFGDPMGTCSGNSTL